MRARFLFLLFFAANFGWLSAQPLTEEVRISLITCGPGDELYATFGHSALHIYDSKSGLDRVYNYGTFDFNTPDFYLKFARGRLDYFLSVSNLNRFVRTYQYEGRWVYRQELNLDYEQILSLYRYLENNAKTENKYYRYDFFYDNCSTRLRDVLEAVLGDQLVYPDMDRDTVATFREMINLYLKHHHWSDLGIDLALGLPCDKEPDYREKMFLPDYLMANIGKAGIVKNGDVVPLVGREGMILAENPRRKADEGSGIMWIFWTLLLFCLITGFEVNPKYLRWFDILFFAVIGILGILILFLWIATDHSATKWNLNLIWALPSWLYGSLLLLVKKPKGRFFKIHAIITFTLMVFWIALPQSYHQAVIPLALSLAARSWSWQKKRFNINTVKHAT